MKETEIEVFTAASGSRHHSDPAGDKARAAIRGIEQQDRDHSGLRDVSSRDDSEELLDVMKVVTAKEQARVGGKDRRSDLTNP